MLWAIRRLILSGSLIYWPQLKTLGASSLSLSLDRLHEGCAVICSREVASWKFCEVIKRVFLCPSRVFST
ncbi:hypothetical protein L1987_31967 [Smallanthus sonchifolius]|uniref:Uncharacterized protein n=1 Tax=Smallanthus sonchifolius TaxID=185202 RepID=A0ACB9I747_9ASTR|nr:hypothetical protein L1987_31967 [Smallanthus sonchifolius]